MAVNTTQGIVLAIFGANAGGHLTSLDANATANGNASLATDLSASAGLILGVDLSSDAVFTSTVLGNLGIAEDSAGYTLASNYFTTNLAAGAGRGDLVAAAVEYLLGSSVDASLTASATAFSTRVTDGVTYSQGEGASVFGVSALQAAAGSAATGGGETFELTTDDDTPAMTGGNDTVTGTTSTLSADDRIVDGSTTDSDTFNLTATADPANMDVTNVENININWDSFGTPDVNLTDVSGATVTISSTKNGYLGNANFTNVGENSLVFGEGMTGSIDVRGIEDATVTADLADYVEIGNTTAADGNVTVNAAVAETVIFNGGDDIIIVAPGADTVTIGATSPDSANITLGADVDLTLTGASSEYTLTSNTADINVNIAAGAVFDTITVSGDNAMTLDFANVADITGDTIVGAGAIVIADDGTTTDLDEVEATSFTFEAAFAGDTTITAQSGDVFVMEDEIATTKTITFQLSATNDATSGDTLTLTVETDNAGTIVTQGGTGDYETVNLIIDETPASGVDVTLAAVDVGTETLNITSDDNELTITSLAAGTVDASQVVEDFEITDQTAAADMEVYGGQADNTVKFAGTTHESTYVSGGTGDDDITFDTTSGTASAVLGSGNSDVTATALTSGNLVVIGGDGENTVTVTTQTGESSVQLGGGDDTFALDITDGGVSETVANLGDGDDTLSLTVDAANGADELIVDFGDGEDTLDLSAPGASSILTDVDFTFTSLEVIDYGAGVGSNVTNVTLDRTDIAGLSYTIKGNGAQTDKFVVTAAAAGTSDFSTLTLDATITDAIGGVDFTAHSGNDTITGTALADTIDTGNGTNSVTGGKGADLITLGSGTDTVIMADDDGSAIGTITDGGGSAADLEDTDTIAFTGDTITSFTSGTDEFDIEESIASIAATTDATATTLGVGDGEAAFVIGDLAAGVFTVDSTGSDLLVVYDADGTSGTTDVEGVVFVGITAIAAADFI